MLLRKWALAVALLGWSSFLSAEVVAGTDYTVLRPVQRTDSPGKIEVIQFFSYGCPHCAEMHSMVDKWAARLPKDVVFKRVPVSFRRPQWASLAKAYYALETTGNLKRLDGAIYEAVHKQGAKLTDEQSITAWMSAKGVDARAFTSAYNSFSVNSNVSRAEGMTSSYRVDGVPYFVVNGRYGVIGHSYEQMLDATNQLIARVRKEDGNKRAARN